MAKIPADADILELTDDEYRSFINKLIYYMTNLHSSQKSKGVKYRDLVRTYQVTFCGYKQPRPTMRSSAGWRREGVFAPNRIELSRKIDIATWIVLYLY